jgi:hypothetical protein
MCEIPLVARSSASCERQQCKHLRKYERLQHLTRSGQRNYVFSTEFLHLIRLLLSMLPRVGHGHVSALPELLQQGKSEEARLVAA